MNKPSMTTRPPAPPVTPRGQLTRANEKQRIYHYLSGAKLVLNNVEGLYIRPSENHRVKADGRLWIVPPGWIALEIDETEWRLND